MATSFFPANHSGFPSVFFGSSGHVTFRLRGLSFVQERKLGLDALTLSDHSLKLLEIVLEIVATFPILRQTFPKNRVTFSKGLDSKLHEIKGEFHKIQLRN